MDIFTCGGAVCLAVPQWLQLSLIISAVGLLGILPAVAYWAWTRSRRMVRRRSRAELLMLLICSGAVLLSQLLGLFGLWVLAADPQAQLSGQAVASPASEPELMMSVRILLLAAPLALTALTVLSCRLFGAEVKQSLAQAAPGFALVAGSVLVLLADDSVHGVGAWVLLMITVFAVVLPLRTVVVNARRQARLEAQLDEPSVVHELSDQQFFDIDSDQSADEGGRTVG